MDETTLLRGSLFMTTGVWCVLTIVYGYATVREKLALSASGDEYAHSAMYQAVYAALKKSSYPWSVLMFTSSYGDGAYKYLWQADSKAEFLKAGDRASVLTAVLGKQAARQMLADWKRCLASSETVDGAARLRRPE